MKVTRYRPVFVEEMPADLEDGTLYVSIRYRTVSHLCACGCRTRVVTPIKPAKWKLKYNGAAVWLSPSIDRSQSACGSHYWIRCNRVDWYTPLSVAQAARTRDRDALDLREYYEKRTNRNVRLPVTAGQFMTPKAPRWRRLWARLRGR